MLALLEILTLVAIVFFFASQIIIPLYRGTPLLPMFKKERGLSIKLAEERQRLIEKKLKADLRKLQK